MLRRQCSNRDLLFHVSTIDVLLAQRRQSMKRAYWRQVVFLIPILLSHFEVLLSRWRWERRKMGSHCRRILEHVRADSVSQSIVYYQVLSNLYHFRNVSQTHWNHAGQNGLLVHDNGRCLVCHLESPAQGRSQCTEACAVLY